MNTEPRPGRLFLVPTPLDHGCDAQVPLDEALPLGTVKQAAAITHWISENAKSTRAFLKRVHALQPLALPLQAQQITELPRAVHKKGDHAGAGAWDARPLLAPALQGHDMGLVSEAGMPAVADPGSSVVRAAHALGIAVVPLTGPISLLMALAASGLNGQNFAFVGYLPQEADERTKRIRELEDIALKTRQTQLFIETPYRNAVLLKALMQCLKPSTHLAVARGLSLTRQAVQSGPISHWRAALQHARAPADDTLPAVFAIGV